MNRTKTSRIFRNISNYSFLLYWKWNN